MSLARGDACVPLLERPHHHFTSNITVATGGFRNAYLCVGMRFVSARGHRLADTARTADDAGVTLRNVQSISTELHPRMTAMGLDGALGRHGTGRMKQPIFPIASLSVKLAGNSQFRIDSSSFV
jgi:hypothetical protein